MEVTLKNTSALAVIDTKGAELKSFKDGFATEYIWQADPAYWAKSSPILFPIVGNLRNDKAIIGGREYTIPKHGLLRTEEFRLVYHTDEKAIFSYMANEKTLESYPFRFNLQLTYTLTGCSLELRYDVFNMDDKPMAFGIGAHPAFNIPLVEEDVFENYSIRFDQASTTTVPVYDLEKLHWDQQNRITLLDNSDTLALDYSLFDNDAVFFDEISPEKIVVCSKLTGRGIQVNLTGFNTVAFWSPIGLKAPFLCIEPWCGTAVYSDEGDVFEEKRNIQTVQPDEKNTYIMKITML